MKVIGRDQVVMYDETHNYRQTPGAVKKWQDSSWLHWWDNDNNVGGVHRIGHEYNYDGEPPRIALWSNLVTPAGIYRHVVGVPLREQDKLPNGWGGGDDTAVRPSTTGSTAGSSTTRRSAFPPSSISAISIPPSAASRARERHRRTSRPTTSMSVVI